ncbi:hypothetical protein [Rhodococcus sp. IEGM 1408]|uniref:hypothetical protein n=1 Tax=Rhodococcus sp. IEGM 1408 TaxID=3082220 RepID=UPI0029550110|nr:hypothetical protein [Rhodococcus sp. IEGM 1408]MDV8001807.1 hypothetical protein [Rhodococcus sp. IEGM 1408]
MTGFWDSGENITPSERRQQRMEEARRRVESGENTSPPPTRAKPAKATKTAGKTAGSRATRTSKSATVDPLSFSGAQFAVWRSVQHFCSTDSIPDAKGKNLDLLVAWSDSIQPFRLRQRIVARLDSQGAWLPVCYAKDGAREAITQAQADRYREARLGETTLSGGALKPLKETDHPEVTEAF